MDIVINSNVQSPLVRTLSATQGKSASFTHHIKDNVPPVSFTKIQLTPDGGSVGTYNRNYKFKIPQYGYLRNFILKFTGSELGIGTAIMTDIYDTCLSLQSDITKGNGIEYVGSSTAKGLLYDLRDLFGAPKTAGATSAPNNQTFVPYGFVPPFEGNIRNGNMDPWATMWGRISGGANYVAGAATGGAMTAYGDARISPYRHTPRYDALSAFGRNQFAQELVATGAGTTITASSTQGYYEEAGGIAFTTLANPTTIVFHQQNVDWSVPVPHEGLEWHVITSTTTDFTTLVPDNNSAFFNTSGYQVSTHGKIGGAIPFNTTDTQGATGSTNVGGYAGVGTCPNVQLRNRYLGQRLQSTYDWCSQANLSKHLGALFPAQVTLSTHNRIIQTIYPSETLSRIYRMPQDKKRMYLAMIRPHIIASPSSVGQNSWAFTETGNSGPAPIIGGGTAGLYTNGLSTLRTAADAFGTYRQFTAYFPCFFSFFEDPSMNLDSRFVENLEVDVLVNPTTNIYAAEDLGDHAINLGTPTPANAATGGFNPNGMTLVMQSRWPLTSYNGWHSSEFRRRVAVVNTSSVTVSALAYYHNFHDSTSQAIRDSNFKPNVPANVLGYNTYAESALSLTAQQLCQGATVNINLSCNNLTSEIIFLVRRVQRNIVANPQQTKQAFEDFMTTLPIRSVVLTGSGQQLYQATGAECMLTDQWDYPLSSVETGSAVTNNTGLYADNHVSMYAQSKPTCDNFFAYRIPFSFSSDRTYNSGAIALQTINNPVLSITFFPLMGWVINDDNLAAERPSFLNLDENMGVDNGQVPTVFNGDFQLEVYENYWQLIRIDSNTGAVTKSLDL